MTEDYKYLVSNRFKLKEYQCLFETVSKFVWLRNLCGNILHSVDVLALGNVLYATGIFMFKQNMEYNV